MSDMAMTDVYCAVAAQPRVLLLDDDPFSLRLHTLMLRGMGVHQITHSRRGEEALPRLLAAPNAVDVIVCDLNMPGMDGIEFLQALNASGFRGGVILVSGEGIRVMHTVQKLLGNGALNILGTIAKPAGPIALQALLARWTSGGTAPTRATVQRYDAADIIAATRAGQWLLHYQPKVDLRSGALVGVEALVRWNHPLHGMVLPDCFIALAEDCGAIDDLTDWVLRAAMAQLASWRQQGMRLHMAVNVSMDNLGLPGFAHRLGTMARDAGVSPAELTLEITESRLMSPTSTPLESLVRLRLQRFGLSIDDFGTGHSSLAQLRDVPFTELKVDRGFVHGARSNPIIRPMLEGSIGIAKRLGMHSVAEGVETQDDWQLLREIGCDLAQGYFIGRPMTAESLPTWWADWQRRSRGLITQ